MTYWHQKGLNVLPRVRLVRKNALTALTRFALYVLRSQKSVIYSSLPISKPRPLQDCFGILGAPTRNFLSEPIKQYGATRYLLVYPTPDAGSHRSTCHSIKPFGVSVQISPRSSLRDRRENPASGTRFTDLSSISGDPSLVTYHKRYPCTLSAVEAH